MADFCHECTLEMTGEPEYARRNDMLADVPGLWQLCECCGMHRFTTDGVRMCLRHPREEDVTMAACPQCMEKP